MGNTLPNQLLQNRIALLGSEVFADFFSQTLTALNFLSPFRPAVLAAHKTHEAPENVKTILNLVCRCLPKASEYPLFERLGDAAHTVISQYLEELSKDCA